MPWEFGHLKIERRKDESILFSTNLNTLKNAIKHTLIYKVVSLLAFFARYNMKKSVYGLKFAIFIVFIFQFTYTYRYIIYV